MAKTGNALERKEGPTIGSPLYVTCVLTGTFGWSNKVGGVPNGVAGNDATCTGVPNELPPFVDLATIIASSCLPAARSRHATYTLLPLFGSTTIEVPEFNVKVCATCVIFHDLPQSVDLATRI